MLLYYKNREWHISKNKVIYIQHGQEIEQYVGSEGKDWWIDFADKWDHTTIIEFKAVTPTDEQLTRLSEINQLNIPEGFGSICSEYVEKAILPNNTKGPLWNLKVQKEQEMQDGYLLDLDFRQSLTEMGV